MPSWFLSHREVNKYLYHRHEASLSQFVPDFSVLVPYTLTACTSAADILSSEPPIVTAPFHPALNMPLFEEFSLSSCMLISSVYS